MSEHGTVQIEKIHDPDRWPCDLIRIVSADPRVWISVELWGKAIAGVIPWLSIDLETCALTLADDYGQKFIYVLTGKRHPTLLAYEIEWPD